MTQLPIRSFASTSSQAPSPGLPRHSLGPRQPGSTMDSATASTRSTTTTTMAGDDYDSAAAVTPTLGPASAPAPAPALQIDTTDLELSSSITSALSLSGSLSPTYSDRSSSPTKLSKSNSRASRQLSVRSCNSVRAIGTIPIGQLVVSPEQQRFNPDDSERSAQRLGRITEERLLRVVNPSIACLDNGDIFRLLELPSNFIVGHDDIAIMTTKPGDDGFRDIPPGPHFLWVQQISLQQGSQGPQETQGTQGLQLDDQHGPAPRCGYWYVTKQSGQIRVKQWDKYNEILGDVASQCEADELKANIESIYPTLRTYKLRSQSQHGNGLSPSLATRFERDPPSPSSSLWHQLTWAISESFLERVTGKRTVHEWLVDSSDCVKGDTHLPLYHKTASRAYKAAVSSELNFLFSQDFPDLDLLDAHIGTHDHDSDPFDTTNRVLALLNNPPAQVTERGIVAELQFAYVTGTQLGNAACLEQWWELVLKIVLRAYQLLRFRPELSRDLLRTLHAQLMHTAGCVENPEDNERSHGTDGLSSDKPLFSSHLKDKRKLRRSLPVYKRRLNESLIELGSQVTLNQQEVGRAFEDLEAWLWRYKWDLRSDLMEDDGGLEFETEEDDDDDLLPVVVDVDENGQERGLVAFDRD